MLRDFHGCWPQWLRYDQLWPFFQLALTCTLGDCELNFYHFPPNGWTRPSDYQIPSAHYGNLLQYTHEIMIIHRKHKTLVRFLVHQEQKSKQMVKLYVCSGRLKISSAMHSKIGSNKLLLLCKLLEGKFQEQSSLGRSPAAGIFHGFGCPIVQHTCLFTGIPRTDQRTDTIEIQPGEPMNFFLKLFEGKR